MESKDNLKRALSVRDIENYKPRLLEFDGAWQASFGTPESRGSILIYGMPKNGKTDLALQMAKYLTRFDRVLYNSVEEGLSGSIREAIRRHNISEVSSRFNFLDGESINDLITRLKRKQSAAFVFIDSVQRAELTMEQYRTLKKTFPSKLFVFVSHVDDSRNPHGIAAKNIKRYSDVFAFVEGFVAYPTCRIGGGKPFIIWHEEAANIGQK